MLADVKLYGDLGEKYGTEHRFDIANAPQAVAALAANYDGFYQDFRDGFYHIQVGDDDISEEHLQLRVGDRTVHIIPTVAGAKRSGGIKAIAGFALLAVATGGASAAIGPFAAGASGFSATAFSVGGFAVSYGSLASTALTLVLQGVSGLLTPQATTNSSQRNPVDQQASFLFNGATNRSAEGTPIPVCYGKFRAGSVVASAGLTVEQLL